MYDSVNKNETVDPLTQWIDLIERRIAALRKNVKDVARLCNCEVDTVKNWLRRQELPDDAQHADLMAALELPSQADITKRKNATGLDWRLAELRSQAENLRTAAEHRLLDELTKPKRPRKNHFEDAAAGPRYADSDPHMHADFVMHDHAAIRELRQHKGNTRYEMFDRKQLLAILGISDPSLFDISTPGLPNKFSDSTQSCHEFLACYRVLKGLRQTALGATYAAVERGMNRPTQEFLDKLRVTLLENDPQAYDRLVDLTIHNRQAIFNHYLRKQDLKSAQFEKEHFPAIYWVESLSRFLDPKKWDARTDKPHWQVETIETQGQYFRAIRYMLQLSPVTVAREAVAFDSEKHTHPKSITNIENEIGGTELKGLRKMLVLYYQSKLKERGLGHYLDMERFNCLPIGNTDKSTTEVWQDSLTPSSDPGMGRKR